MWINELSIVVAITCKMLRNRSVRTQAPDAASIRRLITPAVRHICVSPGIDNHVLRIDERLALPFRQELSLRIKDLYPPISTIQNINAPARVERDAVGQIELSWSTALLAPGLHKLSVGGKLHDSVVAIAIANINAAVRGHRHVRWPVEMLMVIARDATFADRHLQLAFGREFKHLVQGDVGDPHVVVTVS